MDRLAARRIVLVGIGHTHAHIIRMWGQRPIPDTELICISDSSIAAYSGLLPAVLNGQCPESAMQIDLPRLCSSVGASLMIDQITALDLDHKTIVFRERPELSFDVLSIGIGSVPETDSVEFSNPDVVVQLKPMRSFLSNLSNRLNAQLAERAAVAAPVIPENPLQVVVAGAGAAGIEIACGLCSFLEHQNIRHYRITIITATDEILPGVSPGLRKRVQSFLARNHRRFEVITASRIHRVDSSSAYLKSVQLNTGQTLDCDLVVWATGAKAPPILSKLGLPVDERGFLLTDATLKSTSGHPIFAVGDSGTIDELRLPKAGVFAVRQGPVLWKNLNLVLQNQPLQPYVPQSSFMKLLNLGDGTAAGEWKGRSFSGKWVMRLKNRIDHRFMQMYQQFMPTQMADQEQCRGCGCKLGSHLLQEALHKVDQLDDAAVIGLTCGERVIASTDFFTPPLRDYWLSGRIAAQHAMTDLYAMGARVTSALATIVLPEGPEASQQKLLAEILHGIRYELGQVSAQLVGGHTIVGPRIELGVTAIGEPFGAQMLRKRNLKPGDLLYLTKPLGIGVLLAAHMRSRCPASSYDVLLESMLKSQETAARLAVESGLTAGTDVTGFGLLGHLSEMLNASQCSAILNLDAIPALPGALELIHAGIRSSLAPQNHRIPMHIKRFSNHEIHVTPEHRPSPSRAASIPNTSSHSAAIDARYQPILELLYDPQTCGGLLLAAPPHIQLPFPAFPIGKVPP